MYKVATVVGTRPELIKLARVIAEIDASFDHTLIHTGQNYDYELNEVFFQQLDIRKPDHFLDVAAPSAAETIANVISKGDAVLKLLEPDALLVLGDTNSCLVTIAAKKLHIPIFHMEAGNRCFDQRVPEEVNRKIVDHISDINLTYTEHARRYLLNEGLPPDQVIKTGSPMFEVLHHFRDQIGASQVLSELGLQKNNYFVVQGTINLCRPLCNPIFVNREKRNGFALRITLCINGCGTRGVGRCIKGVTGVHMQIAEQWLTGCYIVRTNLVGRPYCFLRKFFVHCSVRFR